MDSHDRRPEFHAAALTVAAWLGFALLQIGLDRSVSTMSAPWGSLFRFYIALAVLWSVLTPLIAAWDRVVRTRWPGILSRLAAHIPTALLAGIADASVRRAMIRVERARPSVPFAATLLYYADLVAVSYTAVILVAEALAESRALAEQQRAASNLEAQLASARLAYLDAQLQPHFLFNSLGAVSELAHEAPLTAARVLRQLASLLRSAFSTESDQVTLGQELVTLDPYLEIQRIRFADWLDIVHDIDDRAADCLVPRLVLQPLVENAVRHGVAGRVAAGCIEIQARIDDDRLIVRVRDNGVGLETRSTNHGRGIGLANLRQRLDALYAREAHLRLFRDDTGTVAELSIPAQRAADVCATTTPSRASIAPPTVIGLAAPPREYSSTAIVAVWAILGLLWTQQSLAYLALRHRLAGISWLDIVRSDLTTALLWAALTVAIFALASRRPIRGFGDRSRIAGYAAGAVVVPAVHILLSRLLGHPTQPLISEAYANMYGLGLVIYSAIVAIGHRRQLARWLFERRTAATRLAVDLAEARSLAAHLRADPEFLFDTLERLALSVTIDPARTERGLARLADVLRISLEDDPARRDPALRAAALDALHAELEPSARAVRGAGAA